MKRLFASVGALTLVALLSATTTRAQSRSFITRDAGPYWWVDMGATIPQDGHITQFGPWSSGQKLTYDVGGGVDGAVGYAFNNYVATEVQVGGTWNSIQSVEGASLQDTYFSTMPILANVVLQCPIPQTRVVPYLGGGVGGAATFFDTGGYSRPVAGGRYVTLNGWESDFVFAWQGFAGVRIGLNDKMSIGVGYRYLHVDPSTYSYESYRGGATLELGLSSHQSHLAAITFLMKF